MINKENRYFYNALSNIQNQNYEKAIEDLIKVIELDEKNLDAYYNLARVYYDIKSYNKALETYNKSIEIYPYDSEIYYNRAEVYIELNKFEEALKDLEKAISINKSFSDAYYLISVILRKQKKYKKAIKYLKKVLETNGEDYIAYYDIYKLYNILINHEKDETKKEKYLNIANKSLKKSADLGYDKAINQLNYFLL